MKKERICEYCGEAAKIGEYFCDTCSKDLIGEFHGVPISVEFSYGSPLDGEEYHFCNYRCLLQFIVKELRKIDDANTIEGEETE